MKRICYYNYGNKKCVTICGSVICDENIVNKYIILCELCNSRDGKFCVEFYDQFNCNTIGSWWNIK
ncbi:hypothetical protein [Saccharolobus caldissimus]|uniref:Uncharacterized protein n=1 Tax=Saccharolobus caldissimus TaxID=1702097 RepID=A0AAQ4CND5_9CREN|nr:hypothetical protein [Saccharolobus caldissimus]BDB97316.1 hypothetical protein SACC_03330 [Saccharolobus caldissimus]